MLKITIEGEAGSGKTYLGKLLRDFLYYQGYKVSHKAYRDEVVTSSDPRPGRLNGRGVLVEEAQWVSKEGDLSQKDVEVLKLLQGAIADAALSINLQRDAIRLVLGSGK